MEKINVDLNRFTPPAEFNQGTCFKKTSEMGEPHFRWFYTSKEVENILRDNPCMIESVIEANVSPVHTVYNTVLKTGDSQKVRRSQIMVVKECQAQRSLHDCKLRKTLSGIVQEQSILVFKV